jgi:hypothetical protein
MYTWTGPDTHHPRVTTGTSNRAARRCRNAATASVPSANRVPIPDSTQNRGITNCEPKAIG